MKWIKRLLLAAVLLVVFLAITLTGIVMLVDPNDYRDEIEAAVKQQTGRNMVMQGDIGLSVFPWLGLELEKIRLNNPPGFADEIFAAVDRVNIKVALLPLLRLETRVGNLELDGLTVNLERRADGVTNWDDLVAAADGAQKQAKIPAQSAPEDKTPEDKATDKTQSTIPQFYIGSLDITHANISWRDAVAKSYTRIEDMSFTTGAILPFKAIPFTLEFSMRNESPKLLAGAKLEGALHLDLVAEQYTLENLSFALQAAGPMVPGGNQTLQMQVPRLAVLTKEQKLRLEQLQLQIAGLSATLDMLVQSYTEKPQVTGKLTAVVPQLRRMMHALGIEPPETADLNVLNDLKAQLAFTYSGEADSAFFETQNLSVVFDDTHLTGSLAVRDFDAPSYKVDLNVDKLNADRYLPPPAPEPEADSKTEEPAEDVKVDLPAKDLRRLKAEGNLRFGELQVMKLKLANLHAGLNAVGDGLVHLEPLTVDLYEGKFEGAVTLDVTGKVPSYKISSQLSQVQIEPLLYDYMQSRFISGRMNARFDLTTAGNRISRFKKNLNGTGDLNFRDGALSMNVREKIRETKAKLKREPYNAPPKQPTTFSSITAGLNFNQGTVSNKDLEVRAGHLYITGQGEYALPTDMIDYAVTLLFSEDPTGQDQTMKEFYDAPIELKLKGKLEQLNYAGILKSGMSGLVKAKAKQAVEEKKDAAKEELKKQLDKKKKEKLEKLFSR